MASRRSGRFLVGAVLILIGLVLLLDTTGVYETGGLRLVLPALLVLFGAYGLVKSRFRRVFGPSLLVLLGGGWAAVVLGVATVGGLLQYWPVLVILLGVSLVLGRRRRQRVYTHWDDKQRSVVEIPGGSDRRVTGSFDDVDAVGVFGTARLDLRDADPEPSARVDAVAVFGTVQLLAPPEWDVKMDAVGVFGSAVDTRSQRPRKDRPDVVVEGAAIFGRIEVVE